MVSSATPAAWADRRVFITGHTGFKGGWLSWWLHMLGARLVGYALPPPTQPSMCHATCIAQIFEQEHLADVRDAEQVKAALQAAQPEVVFHLAAQPLVRRSYLDPLETWSTNVLGTAHVLEAARHCASVRAVVVVTSDKCYREQSGAHREDDPLGGHDPYSASKACAELITSSYRDAFSWTARGVGVATARAGNVFGGGDWTADRLIPDLLRAIDRGESMYLRHPAAVRPWQHVLDPLAGYIMLAEHLLADPASASSAWNFGPDPAGDLTVRQITQRLLARSGAEAAALVHQPPSDPTLHEAPMLRLDATKARRYLGWRGLLTMDQALDWTWAWHQAWRRQQPMRDLTLQQIDAYRTLAAAANATP